MKIKLGRYVCEGTIPIVVTNKGTPADKESHGPWITYCFDDEPPESGVVVFYTTFYALLEHGYRHESETT